MSGKWNTQSNKNSLNHHNLFKSSLPNSTKNFSTDYDDTSDEEDVDHHTENYDADKNWENAQKQLEIQSKKTLANDSLLSFIAHAAGIKLLYSKPVNKLYYPLKKKILSEQPDIGNADAQLQLLVKNAVKESIDKTFISLKDFINSTQQTQFSNENIDQIFKAIKDEFNLGTEKIISDNHYMLIACIRENTFSSHLDNADAIQVFKKQSLDLLTAILLKHMQLKTGKIDRLKVKNDLFALATKNISKITNQLKIDKNENAAGRENAISVLNNYKGDYKNTAIALHDILIKCNARGHVSNMIAKNLNDKNQQLKIIQSYVGDLKSLPANEHKQMLNPSAENIAYNNFFSFDKESITDELKDIFSFTLDKNLTCALKQFHRPTLGNHFLFSSNNPYEFYANLRLSNRSQLRQIANLQSALFPSHSATRMWRLNNKLDADTDVIEDQEILGSSFGRRDMVFGIGNYKKIYESIKQLKTYLQTQNQDVTDNKIAEWIRSIFKGKLVDFNLSQIDKTVITHKLNTITYLLFGCEVTRNPAMSVINQMLLDLIITNSKVTFEEIFTGKVADNSSGDNAKMMPMAPEGAVAAARSLEDDYREFMPYPYLYRGTEDRNGEDGKLSKNSLTIFEARIVRSWLNECASSSITMPAQHQAQWILNLIQQHFTNWLGDPAQQEITSRKVHKNI